MSEPFLGEVKIISWNFPPKGWAFCDGQLVPINQNQALFSILGTTYGGDGKSAFGLPNLQGSVPLQQGQGPGLSLYDLGQTGGEPTVTLLQSELPFHPHQAQSTGSGNQTSPAINVWCPLSGRSPPVAYSN